MKDLRSFMGHMHKEVHGFIRKSIYRVLIFIAVAVVLFMLAMNLLNNWSIHNCPGHPEEKERRGMIIYVACPIHYTLEFLQKF